MILAHVLPTWLWHLTNWPVDQGKNGGYGFWSGIAGSFIMSSGIFALYKHHECHVDGCRRVGKPVSGTSFVACKRHHPHRQEKVTAEHIAHAAKHGHYPGGPT